MIADKNGDEMKAEQENCIRQEGEIKEYLSKLEERYYKLKVEETRAAKQRMLEQIAADKAARQAEKEGRKEEEEKQAKQEKEASTRETFVSAVDKRMAALEQAIKEQLEDSRKRQEKEETTKEKIEAYFRVELEGLKEKVELISSHVTKIPLSVWKNVEENKAEKLEQRTVDLIAKKAEADTSSMILLGVLTLGRLQNKQQVLSKKLMVS